MEQTDYPIKGNRIEARFLGMRKPDSLVVYPKGTVEITEGGRAPMTLIKVQGERCIGIFDPVTGKGFLNWRGNHSKYGQHFRPELGAEPFEFPAAFVDACLRIQLKPGDRIGPGVIVGGELEPRLDVGAREKTGACP